MLLRQDSHQVSLCEVSQVEQNASDLLSPFSLQGKTVLQFLWRQEVFLDEKLSNQFSNQAFWNLLEKAVGWSFADQALLEAVNLNPLNEVVKGDLLVLVFKDGCLLDAKNHLRWERAS